jgi:molybdate transport system ATP-binding protein
MTVLSLDVTVSLGGFTLQVNEELELGSFTALFGPSGAGKTTLLRVIAGLEPGVRGRIALDEAVWQDGAKGEFVPPYRRDLGYVFQDARLFPHLSVERNLRFARQRSANPAPLSLDEVIGALELRNLLQRDPGSLSGGEQQRVAMGRALLRSPSLLLMDEPLSALDVRRKAEVIPYIERLSREFGIPVLYVTHNVEEVARLASDMVLLADGRVAAKGSVAEVLERIELWPITGRLDAGTVLEARVRGSRNGMTSLDIEGEQLRIPALEIAPETLVHLRVQARDVALATARPRGLSIRNVLTARILSIDFEESVFAEVLLAVGAQHLRARVTREAVEELQLAAGLEVFALVKSVAFDGRLLS